MSKHEEVCGVFVQTAFELHLIFRIFWKCDQNMPDPYIIRNKITLIISPFPSSLLKKRKKNHCSVLLYYREYDFHFRLLINPIKRRRAGSNKDSLLVP